MTLIANLIYVVHIPTWRILMAINDRPFSIRVSGDSSGETWVGDFRAKVALTRRDVINKDRIRREMLGPTGEPDEHSRMLAIAYGELKVRITEAPKWFLESDFGMDLEDETPMAAVYKEAMKIANDAVAEKIKDAEAKAAEMKKETEDGNK
jgi:hypothetical protein